MSWRLLGPVLALVILAASCAGPPELSPGARCADRAREVHGAIFCTDTPTTWPDSFTAVPDTTTWSVDGWRVVYCNHGGYIDVPQDLLHRCPRFASPARYWQDSLWRFHQ